MPAQSTPPLIPELPPAPSRSEGQAAFNLTAGPFIAAMPPMVVNINTSLTWIGQQVTAVDGYRQAAATSAGNAADSASAANAAKNAAAQSATDATNNGKAQVNLAKDQVTLAQQAAAAAQSAAQAAGAAAGLPGGRVPFTVLQINAQGNVSWGDGLIDKTNALPGQALMLGTAKAPKWDFPGLRVGDILQTSRQPGSNFLPAAGGIYLQSSYPALFAVVGLIGIPAGQVWVADNVNNYSEGAIETDGKGVWYRGGKRSTDDGLTWVTADASARVFEVLKNDGKGTWIGGLNGVFYRSTDNGVTWVSVWSSNTVGAGYPSLAIDTDGNGTWVVGCYTSPYIRRSTDNGATWSAVTGVTQPVTGLAYLGGGVWINSRGQRSTDNGATWVSYGASLTSTTTAQTPMKVNAAGEIFGSGSAGINKSINGGLTWQVVGGPGEARSIALDPTGRVVALDNNSYNINLSQDSGQTWQTITTVVSLRPQYVAYGTNKFISNGRAGNGVAKSVETFDYDKVTQFKLPNPSKDSNLQTYIKAFEVAA